MAKKDNTRPKNLDAKIAEKLDEAFDIAEEYFVTKDEAIPNFATDNLNREFIDALELMAKYCEKASGGYSNLITSLAIKAVMVIRSMFDIIKSKSKIKLTVRQDLISEEFQKELFTLGWMRMSSMEQNLAGKQERLKDQNHICWIMTRTLEPSRSPF